jgi:hypothetical protein
VTATKKTAPKRMLVNIDKVVVVPLTTTDKQPTKPYIVGIGDDVCPYAYILVLGFHMNMHGVLPSPNDAYHHVVKLFVFEDGSLVERQRAINHICFTKEHHESIMEGNYSYNSIHCNSLQQHGTTGEVTTIVHVASTYTYLSHDTHIGKYHTPRFSWERKV